MLKKIRVVSAAIFFTMITLLFLDFTGTLHAWFGWMAKIQFLPAVLSLNVAVVALLVILTLVFGRIYCSTICPLGVMQDIIAWAGKKSKKNRYSYSPAKKVLRYSMLAVFVAATVAGIGSITALLAPYSSFGRIASNLIAPLYAWGNNLLAYFAERAESYMFYSTEVWIKSLPVFVLAVVTFVVIAVLSWKWGRTYCNTICPVGTVLGFLAKFSWFKPVFDKSKCGGCTLCEKNCKAACINTAERSIDYGRCVACGECMEVCKKGAMKYMHVSKADAACQAADTAAADNAVSANGAKSEACAASDAGRRAFIAATAVVASSSVLKAQQTKVDGGLATILDKKVPARKTPIVPPGAMSLKNMAQHCTGCQLCVSVCPNGVLRPSTALDTLMQPESSYERGYCRPECNKCSEVCPAGAIRPISVEDKSSTQIGHAVWVKENCIIVSDGVDCGNCARHCPVGAIKMVPMPTENKVSNKRLVRIPAVDEERCIGCGACENLCPSRPFSAIYVEGHQVHKTI